MTKLRRTRPRWTRLALSSLVGHDWDDLGWRVRLGLIAVPILLFFLPFVKHWLGWRCG